MIAVGATVGNYRVLKQIGQGAMGAVFLAAHPVIGKKVALKVIHPELATNEEMLLRFFNEARAVTQIGHQNIVDVQDFGQTPEGDSFIIMELLEGRGLGEVSKAEGPLAIRRALHIAAQIADGLSAAHARGIIHRDLKPDNVFLVERGGEPDFVKILDFGLAKLQGPGAGAMHLKTKTGSLLGTPHFMAPEQAEGKPIDHRVDVYALGCIVFQLVTGRVPFPGDGYGEVLVKHLREPPPLPTRINPSVPPDVEKIILHALAKKPEFRFGSMDELAAALRAPAEFVRRLEASGIHAPPPPARPVVAPEPEVRIEPPRPLHPGLRLPGDAPTLQGAAPPEVQALVEARRAQPSRSEARTTPSMQAASGALDEVPRSRGPLIAVAVVATLAVAGGLVALVSALRPRSVALSVSTEPSGAEVREGERVLGTSPLEVQLPKGEAPLRLTIAKAGYLSAQRVVTPAADVQLAVKLLEKPAAEAAATPTGSVAAPALVAAPAPVAAAAVPVAPGAPPARPVAAPAPVAAAAVPAAPVAAPTAAVAAAPGEKPKARPRPKRPKVDTADDHLLLTPSF